MSLGFDYQKFFVMYVDDEAQSLKYFHKNFGKDFKIVTAENSAEGMEILKNQGQHIGVLLTDQRMPGAPGTELLNFAQLNYPEITRILVTAYSDLETAVTAVNSGGAFRYLTKPWDLRELKGILLRAMEYFLLQHDRNRLIREKMMVVQTMLVMDRLRGVATYLSACSPEKSAAPQGLEMYVTTGRRLGLGNPTMDPAQPVDVWALSRREGAELIENARALKVPHLLAKPSTDSVNWTSIIQGLQVTPGLQADSNTTATPVLSEGDRRLAEQFVRNLADLNSQSELRLVSCQPSSQANGVAIDVQIAAANPQSFQQLFSRVNGSRTTSADLLDGFLAVAALGGTVRDQKIVDALCHLNFWIPNSESRTSLGAFDVPWFERVFSSIEDPYGI